MEVTEDLIKHVAELARLELTDEEVKKFTPELKEVIGAFAELAEENTTGVKPSFQPIEIKNVMREDHVSDSLTQEEALENAEHRQDGFFKGPKAV